MSGRLLLGDALTTLKTMPPVSVDSVLTSPPYFQLRDYGVRGQLGRESEVGDWVATLRAVATELRRVLVPTGTLWLNLGDSYAAHPRQGVRRKSLLLAPERLALALVTDGWLLRNKIVWQKSNPMPTSVRDRLAATWETLYVFAKSPQYYFDLDTVRQPHRSRPAKRHRITAQVHGRDAWRGPNSAGTSGLLALKAAGLVGHPLGRNPGDVWRIASSNYRGSHRATFPEALAERALLAGCPEKRCSRCRAPWLRQLDRRPNGTASRLPLRPTCTCAAPSEPGIVLDPFMGSGTTAVVAESLGRSWQGIELNAGFADEALARIQAARPPDLSQAA